MTRLLRVAVAAGGLGAIVWIVLALNGFAVMPAYLAAWLCWMALPLGALPLLMLFELVGVRGWAVEVPLRRLLLLLPPGALLAVPLMIGAAPLFGRAHIPGALPAGYAAPTFLLLRMGAMLLVWVALGLVFCRPPRRGPRPRLAALGLMLHLVLGSVAAVDWVMSIDPGIGSSAFGLLVIAGQMGAALSLAALLLAVNAHERALPAELPPLMLAVLGFWVFMHTTQYLVVWSANLPAEILWYLHRDMGLGGFAMASAASASLLALILLLPYSLAKIPVVMASIASMLLVAHLVEAWWLVTPGFRGRFVVAAADVPAMLGLAGAAAALLLGLSIISRRHANEAGHAKEAGHAAA